MFRLQYINHFLRKVKKNKHSEQEINKTFDLLENNPIQKKLKTHKVTSKYTGEECFSSSVNGDFRILWEWNNDEIHVIDCIDIGGHSGKNSVYK